VAAGAEGAAAEGAAVVVAVEDAEDKAPADKEKTNEIKNEYYEFLEIYADRFCDC
jgi:hypothetical protein